MQDPERPAVMYNHDNPAEMLHYQDDWWVWDGGRS